MTDEFEARVSAFSALPGRCGEAVEGRTLALAFQRQRREWSLCGAEIRSGEQATTTFRRSELARAIAALVPTPAVAGQPSGGSGPRAIGVGNAGSSDGAAADSG